MDLRLLKLVKHQGFYSFCCLDTVAGSEAARAEVCQVHFEVCLLNGILKPSPAVSYLGCSDFRDMSLMALKHLEVAKGS